MHGVLKPLELALPRVEVKSSCLTDTGAFSPLANPFYHERQS